MAKSTYAIDVVLNALLRDTPYTSPTTVYVGLLDGTTEVSGGSYARQAITFGAPDSSGTCTSTNSQTFSNMPATTVNNVGIYDSATVGNQLYVAPTTAAKTTNDGDTVTIATGGIIVTES
jgi:hypothetical protein